MVVSMLMLYKCKHKNVNVQEILCFSCYLSYKYNKITLCGMHAPCFWGIEAWSISI